MPKNIKIGDREVGLNKKIFISAEVGTTCNGDFETSKKLIDAATDAGMDAVKFQFLNPDDKYSDKTLTYSYKRHDGEVVTENIHEMLKQYIQPEEDWKKLKEYADEKGIIMFATPDYIGGVEMMDRIGMQVVKVATWDVTFYPFLKKIAKLGKPAVLDFGASDSEDVARVIKIFEDEGNDKLILLHCYHTSDFKQMNIRTVEYYRLAFGHLSGFSAPDANNDIDYLSLPYKPVYIEKRLTLDRRDPNHHHCQALEPAEMKDYVKRIHELAEARGEFILKPSEGDLSARKEFFRRIVAKKDIKKGEIFTEDNIACRRPMEGGLDPQYYDVVLGREVKMDLAENEPITWEKI